MLLGPPLIALVMIGILALYPLRATVHLSYYVSATNTFAFWSLALNLSLWGLQSHFWARAAVYLPAWWRRAALPATALNRLATNRFQGEQIAAAVSLITINACLLVLSSFMAWRAQGIIIVVVNNLLFIAVENKTGRMRQLLLQSSRAQDALESLARQTLFYLIFQMCAFVLNLVESMDNRYSAICTFPSLCATPKLWVLQRRSRNFAGRRLTTRATWRRTAQPRTPSDSRTGTAGAPAATMADSTCIRP